MKLYDTKEQTYYSKDMIVKQKTSINMTSAVVSRFILFSYIPCLITIF